MHLDLIITHEYQKTAGKIKEYDFLYVGENTEKYTFFA